MKKAHTVGLSVIAVYQHSQIDGEPESPTRIIAARATATSHLHGDDGDSYDVSDDGDGEEQ